MEQKNQNLSETHSVSEERLENEEERLPVQQMATNEEKATATEIKEAVTELNVDENTRERG